MCDAIHWGVENKSDEAKEQIEITYLQMNMDIDGPMSQNTYFDVLKQDEPIDTLMKITQIKAFNHYSYKRSEQRIQCDTVREIDDDDCEEQHCITLPTLQAHKTKHMDEVLIETQYVLNESMKIRRYHGHRRSKATKAKIAKVFIPSKLPTKEMHRKEVVKQKIYDKHQAHGNAVLFDDDTNERHENEQNINDNAAIESTQTIASNNNNDNRPISQQKRKKRKLNKKYKCAYCARKFAYKKNRENHQNGCCGR
eukprot:468580_1